MLRASGSCCQSWCRTCCWYRCDKPSNPSCLLSVWVCKRQLSVQQRPSSAILLLNGQHILLNINARHTCISRRARPRMRMACACARPLCSSKGSWERRPIPTLRLRSSMSEFQLLMSSSLVLHHVIGITNP